MSVQFGRWNFDGQPVSDKYLQQVRSIIAPYGPDGSSAFARAEIAILFLAFHTNLESPKEPQPSVLKSGVVVTWDGTLDNREDLILQLSQRSLNDSPDVSIVSAAYERWGMDCFAKLIGDWAFAAWNPANRALVLAKDFVGTRQLYYCLEKDHVTWSTLLDPLVLCSRKTFSLNEAYVAGWIASFPATHLTPYSGVHAVPARSVVIVCPGKHVTQSHWDFDSVKNIRYRSDAEYEEHYRFVFTESVRRRLRSDKPVVAELSGGMDSSAIVCVADAILEHGSGPAPRLDTVSYYDDSEPTWNERPYFTRVERQRGRPGCHIDVSAEPLPTARAETDWYPSTPASFGRVTNAGRKLADYLTSQNNRVLLSGTGGDEVTGGVPNPIPEIQDLMVSAQLGALPARLRVWALDKKCPWFHLALEALAGFLHPSRSSLRALRRTYQCLQPRFIRRNSAALSASNKRMTLSGPFPSFQHNQSTLEQLRRQLSCETAPFRPLYEKRYPYLDRDFLSFLFALPREQLVRPGQRRSLMRRALKEIVPTEVLNRRRKAFLGRLPLTAISRECDHLSGSASGHLTSSVLGIVDRHKLSAAMNAICEYNESPAPAMMRILALELWLRSVMHSNVLTVPVM